MSAWTVFGVGALGLFVLLHTILYACRYRLAGWEADDWPFVKFFSPSGIERRRPYLFTAFAVLAVAWGYVCTLMLLSVFYLEPSRLGLWPDLVGCGASVASLLALLVCVFHLALHTVRGVWLRVTLFRKSLVQPQYVLLLVAFSAAIVAGVSAAAYLVPILRQGDAAVYYFQRATHAGNGVSPTLPLMLVAALVYLWSFAHLRRLSNVSGARIDRVTAAARTAGRRRARQARRDVASVHRCRRAGAAASAHRRRPGHVPHRRVPRLAPSAVEPGAALVHLSRFARPGSSLQILLWLAFAHVAYFWHTLRQAMHAFAGTPMIGAFRRLSPDLFHDRLSPRQPDDADMRRMMHTARQLGLALDELKDPEHGRVDARRCCEARRRRAGGR